MSDSTIENTSCCCSYRSSLSSLLIMVSSLEKIASNDARRLSLILLYALADSRRLRFSVSASIFIFSRRSFFTSRRCIIQNNTPTIIKYNRYAHHVLQNGGLITISMQLSSTPIWLQSSSSFTANVYVPGASPAKEILGLPTSVFIHLSLNPSSLYTY